MVTKNYDIVEKQPAAKFYYRGSHTHPVRRTVLIIEDLPKVLIGYEIREGNDVRSVKNAPIKSYRKDRIAKGGDYCRLPVNTKLERMDLFKLLKAGL